MSLLNLGLQNVALQRVEMPAQHEAAVQNASSMDAVRQAGAVHGDAFIQAWAESMQGPIGILQQRFEMLEWTGHPVQSYSAAQNAARAQLQAVLIDAPVNLCNVEEGLHCDKWCVPKPSVNSLFSGRRTSRFRDT